MKSALLNAIYRTAGEESVHDLKDAILYYMEKVYLLYIDALDSANVNNLDEMIEVTLKFPDGYTMTNTLRAGDHLIDMVLDSDEYRKNIQKLDEIFLQHSHCPEKEEHLAYLKYILSEVGAETLDKDEWTEAVLSAMSECS